MMGAMVDSTVEGDGIAGTTGGASIVVDGTVIDGIVVDFIGIIITVIGGLTDASGKLLLGMASGAVRGA
jgi:hypothetical protein